MNSDDVRRRLLDERARNPADFIGMSDRPESLADSVGFQPIRARVGELQSEQFRQANSNSCKPRPLIGGPSVPLFDYTTHQVGGNATLDGSNPTVTRYPGYITCLGDAVNASGAINNVSAGVPAIGDVVAGSYSTSGTGDVANTSNQMLNYAGPNTPQVGNKVVGAFIPANTFITVYNAGTNVITMSNAATGTLVGQSTTLSAVVSGTLTAVTPLGGGLYNVTSNVNCVGGETQMTMTFTGSTHDYPAGASGDYTFGYNLFPQFNPSGNFADGSPPPTNHSGTCTAKIEILDGAAAVLSTALLTMTMGVTGAWVVTITYVSYTQGSETYSTFRGVKFSTTGNDGNGGSILALGATLNILDVADTVVAK